MDCVSKTKARPEDIPASPSNVYKNKGWASWGDWLGIDRIANQNRTWLSFEKARAFVRKLGLKGQGDWRQWSKTNARPRSIPSLPSKVYKDDGWAGWGDWLGTSTIANQDRVYLPF